jgi:hypothetical protein
MRYAKVIDNIVVHIAHSEKDGFVAVADSVGPGFIQAADGSFTRPPFPSGLPLERLREERNYRLAETDWWILRGNPTDDQLIYRQELRDLPKISEPKLDESGQLTNVVWPEKPE